MGSGSGWRGAVVAGRLAVLMLGAGVMGALAPVPGLAPAEAAAAIVAIPYCHGYGCALRSPVRLSSGDLKTLKAIMARGAGGAAAERAAIGKANQWFERVAGAQTGTSSDGAKDVYQLFTPPSQIDCVDEAENTTALLKLIASRGWLRHHAVGRIERRGFLVDGRYPHHTATLRDTASGQVWVVDSWVRANAQPPDIKPLDVWKQEGGLRG